MDLTLTIKYLAKQNGIDSVDFLNDVKLMDEGQGAFISEWNLPFVEPSQTELEEASSEAELQKEALLYSELRKASYPSIEEQLDMMYWDKINGTSEWSTTITNIKQRFPKE